MLHTVGCCVACWFELHAVSVILMYVVVGVLGPGSLLDNSMWHVLYSMLVHGKHVSFMCIVVALYVPWCVLLSIYTASP